MTTGKTIALITWIFISKVMSLLLNTLSGFVIAFLPRNKHHLILWLIKWDKMSQNHESSRLWLHRSAVFDSFRPCGLQQTRPPCRLRYAGHPGAVWRECGCRCALGHRPRERPGLSCTLKAWPAQRLPADLAGGRSGWPARVGPGSASAPGDMFKLR